MFHKNSSFWYQKCWPIQFLKTFKMLHTQCLNRLPCFPTFTKIRNLLQIAVSFFRLFSMRWRKYFCRSRLSIHSTRVGRLSCLQCQCFPTITWEWWVSYFQQYNHFNCTSLIWLQSLSSQCSLSKCWHAVFSRSLLFNNGWPDKEITPLLENRLWTGQKWKWLTWDSHFGANST